MGEDCLDRYAQGAIRFVERLPQKIVPTSALSAAKKTLNHYRHRVRAGD
jgi:hypothetical protein